MPSSTRATCPSASASSRRAGSSCSAAATPGALRRPQHRRRDARAARSTTTIQAGDMVGIGIHTGNALRGYEIGQMARERGATRRLRRHPRHPLSRGGARARRRPRRGQGRRRRRLGPGPGRHRGGHASQPVYDGGRVDGRVLQPARWDLLPADSYMWASVQTVRGCPKHCSFCSVWRTDGQKPRQRARRRRRRGDRGAAAHGLPLHRARRRQLLPGLAGGPADGRRDARTRRACTSSRRSAPSGSS